MPAAMMSSPVQAPCASINVPVCYDSSHFYYLYLLTMTHWMITSATSEIILKCLKTPYCYLMGKLSVMIPCLSHSYVVLFYLMFCYAQALGVVGIGSLLVELSERIRVHSGRPSCRASQGQNHGVRRGCRGSGEVRQST